MNGRELCLLIRVHIQGALPRSQGRWAACTWEKAKNASRGRVGERASRCRDLAKANCGTLKGARPAPFRPLLCRARQERAQIIGPFVEIPRGARTTKVHPLGAAREDGNFQLSRVGASRGCIDFCHCQRFAASRGTMLAHQKKRICRSSHTTDRWYCSLTISPAQTFYSPPRRYWYNWVAFSTNSYTLYINAAVCVYKIWTTSTYSHITISPYKALHCVKREHLNCRLTLLLNKFCLHYCLVIIGCIFKLTILWNHFQKEHQCLVL